MSDPILSTSPLGFPWETPDPFLFCAHHDDAYPVGDGSMGPRASLAGRDLGQDFGRKDGWSMYHGLEIPGFPQHPHRGFETITLVRTGVLDHSDSMGATARFGGGDVQWLTAGRGILHAEMFPLVKDDKPNPLELFQIWLNLPAKQKMVDPYFSMYWSKDIPRHRFPDAAGRVTEVVTVAGSLGDGAMPKPPPNSWANDAASDLAVWTIRLAPGAEWTLPAARPGTNRSLYVFRGAGLKLAGRSIANRSMVKLRADVAAPLANGTEPTEILLLQGRPIGEPVVQYGPFVMNSREEIQQTIMEYRRTQFGGWPWRSDDPVHPKEEGRFARHADGRIERPA